MNKPETSHGSGSTNIGRDQFMQVPPPRDLAPYVEAILGRQADSAPATFEVFPGARAELLFHFADALYANPATATDLRPLWRTAFLGPRTSRCGQQAGPVIDWFIIQLTPAGCRRFLGHSFCELIDYDAPLEEMMPGADLLWEQLTGLGDFNQRVGLAIAWMRQRMCRAEGDANISRIVSLTRVHPISSARILASMLDYSERRLRQTFASEIGVSPKSWLTLMRANRYLWSLYSGDPTSEFEYADESHAIRSFKQFSGMTPGEFRRLNARKNPVASSGRNQPLIKVMYSS